MSESTKGSIRRVAMLSTHGYFDPVPTLGRTDTGGQVVYVLQLSKALVDHGVPVDIYTRWFDPKVPQVDPVPECEDVRVIRIPAGRFEFLAKEEIYDVLPELAANMTAFIRENGLDYDLYHGHYVDAGIVTLNVARERSKPAFFTAHSLGAWKRDQMGGDPREMERRFNFEHRIAEELRIFRSVRAQTVTTELQREKLKELYGFESDRVRVIPPGVDVDRFRPGDRIEAKRSTGIRDRYVFCLSRIDTNKGHDLLLHAFDVVQAKIPDVRLLIGGGSPKPKERELGVFETMRSIVAEKGMEDRVEILGYVPDETLVPLYRGAEIFALPSLFEPFGMTALEAMACGIPVVASKFGGIKDVISPGKNGTLVDPTDPEEFANALIALLEDPENARELGQAGMDSVRREFSWEAIARKHLAFYRTFMEKK
jgi:mannosylfructose-phosphate synthase